MARNTLRAQGISFAFNATPGQSSSDSRSIQVNSTTSISQKNHEALMTHIKDRMLVSKGLRDRLADRYERIDRDIYGYIRLDQEDKDREIDNLQGKGIKPTDAKLTLTWAQLDDALTYILGVLAPSEDIYKAQAPEEKQEVAKGFTVLMNEHSDTYGHFLTYAMSIFDCLKYNWGAFSPEWNQIAGQKIVPNRGIETSVRDIVISGNKLAWLDPYNTFYDVSVDPTIIWRDGEYFADVDIFTKFRLAKMRHDGEIFYDEDDIGTDMGSVVFYRTRPDIRPEIHGTFASGGHTHFTNWLDIFSAGASLEVVSAFEKVRFRAWVIPSDFGLSDVKDMQIWEFHVLNNQRICLARELTNAHGYLPMCCAMPIQDGYRWDARSYAEHLQPYNDFASFELNMHKRAERKALVGGLTIFDNRVIPLLGSDRTDLAGGKVPANAVGAEQLDLRKAVTQLNDSSDTSNTMQNIEAMDKLMQKIMPTDQANQVAGLERATQYQAAAVVQSTSRRNLKIAKIIYSQAWVPNQHIQMFNIFQFQDQITIIDKFGKSVEIDPRQFIQAGLRFVVHPGLRGIDQLAMILHFKDVLNSVLQSSDAAQQLDIVDILDYWTSMLGDYTDLRQFRIESPMDKLPPEQRTQAFELYQRALQEAATTGGQGTQQAGAEGSANVRQLTGR